MNKNKTPNFRRYKILKKGTILHPNNRMVKHAIVISAPKTGPIKVKIDFGKTVYLTKKFIEENYSTSNDDYRI